MSLNTQRIAYIDMAKAIAIFMVVTGHVLFFSVSQRNGFAQPLFFNKFIGLLQMPLFIFCSGLVVKTTAMNLKEVGKDTYKRFRQLLVPMIIVGACFALVYRIHVLDFAYHSMKSGYWYLLTLFELYLLSYPFALLANKNENKRKSIIFDLIIGGGIMVCLSVFYTPCEENVHNFENLISLGQLNIYFPYFYGAYMLKKYNLMDKIIRNEYIYVISLVATFFLLWVYAQDIQVRGLNRIAPWFMIIGTLGFLSRVANTQNWTVRALNYIGRHTLDIYIFHYFFVVTMSLGFIMPLLMQYNSFSLTLITTLPFTAFAIAMSLLLGKIIHSSKIIDRIIFYKK